MCGISARSTCHRNRSTGSSSRPMGSKKFLQRNPSLWIFALLFVILAWPASFTWVQANQDIDYGPPYSCYHFDDAGGSYIHRIDHYSGCNIRFEGGYDGGSITGESWAGPGLGTAWTKSFYDLSPIDQN